MLEGTFRIVANRHFPEDKDTGKEAYTKSYILMFSSGTFVESDSPRFGLHGGKMGWEIYSRSTAETVLEKISTEQGTLYSDFELQVRYRFSQEWFDLDCADSVIDELAEL